MTVVPIRDNGVLAALRAGGGVNSLARLLNIKSSSVCGWPRVPATRVLEIEQKTGGLVTRYEMRPDLYPIVDEQDPKKKGFMSELLGEKKRVRFRYKKMSLE